MRATISYRKPTILHEADYGEFFSLLGNCFLDECVYARAWDPAGNTDDAHPNFPNCMVVVVVACRVNRGEHGHMDVGHIIRLPIDTPITLLDQVEPLAFRERGGRADSVAMKPETEFALRPAFSGESFLVVPKKAHFSADIDLDGRTLDTERVLLGFRRLIDDCLSDAQAKFKCPGCRCITLKKREDYCHVCQTVVIGVEAPPRMS